MNNCSSCYASCPDNACSTKLRTMKCNPNSKKTWFKSPVKYDQIRENIKNGLWLCNFEPQQTENNILCQRHFFDGHIVPPYNFPHRINLESVNRNLNKLSVNKSCP